MGLRKFSVVLAADSTVHLPDRVGQIEAIALKSSADTSVSLTVTDYLSRTISTWASADYTTRTFRRIGPVETAIFDAGGDVSADTEHSPSGIVFEGPLTLTVGATVGSGELQVDIYYRPLTKVTVVADTLNTAPKIQLPEGVGVLKAVGVLSSSDTSVGLTVTDGAPVARTLATFASADYTTRAVRHIGSVETDVYDSGGDPSADTEGNDIGVLAESSITGTTSGLGAGTLTVDYYLELYG